MKNVRFTLRISQEMLFKLKYISEYEGIPKNEKVEQLIKKRIADYEKANGTITIEK